MLTDGALFSTKLVDTAGGKISPYTPELEDEMFGAFDYVFAEYSTTGGDDRYGDVTVILHPEEVLPLSWGSRGSGWRVANSNKGGTIETHRHAFLKEVFHPLHYSEAIGLEAVRRWRELPLEKRAALKDAPKGAWPDLLSDAGFGKLELKMKTSVLLQAVKSVRLPSKARGDIPELLRSRAISFEYDVAR